MFTATAAEAGCLEVKDIGMETIVIFQTNNKNETN